MSHGLGLLSRTTTANDVVNTVAETTLYSYQIPAGLLRTNRMVRLTIVGDYLNNSGSSRTVQFKVKFGGVTVFDDVTGNLTTNAARRAVDLQVMVANLGVTNSQAVWGRVRISAAGGTTTGLGDLNTTLTTDGQIYGTDPAADTTSAQTLDVTVTHSLNDANISIRRLYGFVELL